MTDYSGQFSRIRFLWSRRLFSFIKGLIFSYKRPLPDTKKRGEKEGGKRREKLKRVVRSIEGSELKKTRRKSQAES